MVDIYHYGWKKYVLKAIDKLLAEVKIDYVVLSYGPPIILTLAHELSKRYKLKTIVEFRDAYINETDEGLILKIKTRTLNKLCSNVKAFIFASDGMRDYFFKTVNNKLQTKPVFTLHHGFDADQMLNNGSLISTDIKVINMFEDFKKHKELIAIFPGTLYKGQDMEFFIKALKQINSSKKELLGIILLGAYFDSRDKIEESNDLIILPRVSKNCSLKLLNKSDILLLPVWQGRYTGLSGKVSEYCGLNKLIAVSPKPQTDLMEFLKCNENAHVFSTVDEFVKFTENVLTQKIKPVMHTTNIYSREYSYLQLSKFIKNLNEAN